MTSNREMLDELVKLTARLDKMPLKSIVGRNRDLVESEKLERVNQPDPADATAIRIFQYFESDAASVRPEEGVIPLPLRIANDGDLYHRVSLDLQEDMTRSGVEIWGLFSPGMQNQSGLNARAIKAIVDKRSSYDAYVVHTDRMAECLHENPWIHGESEIHGFLKLVSKLADQLDIDLGELKSVHPRNSFLYGNHVIGTARFWSLYNSFVARANGELMAILELDGMSSDQWPASRDRMEIGRLIAAYRNRLVSLFISGPGKGLKILKINPLRERSTEQEWLDVAGYLRDRYLSELSLDTKSYWLKVRDFCRNQ